jgi:erythritol kinase
VKPVLIGLDAGTSVIKAVAFDGDGHQVDSAAVRHPVRHGPNGRAEQGMAEAWAGARDAIAALVERNPSLKNDIQAIAVTGQGDGTWLIDRDGAAIEPAIIWMDGRASSIAAALRRSDEGAELYRQRGEPIDPELSAQMAGRA